MAIYKYKCPECGVKVERIQEVGSEEVPHCPDGLQENETCEESSKPAEVKFERVIGKPNAHFKGEGFHTTDYDNSSNPASS